MTTSATIGMRVLDHSLPSRGADRPIQLVDGHQTSGCAATRIQPNLPRWPVDRAGQTQPARRIQEEKNALASSHWRTERPCPCPLANGQICPDRTPAMARSTRKRKAMEGTSTIHSHRLHGNDCCGSGPPRDSKHCTGKHHPCPPREVFPLCAQNALGRGLVRFTESLCTQLANCKKNQGSKKHRSPMRIANLFPERSGPWQFLGVRRQ